MDFAAPATKANPPVIKLIRDVLLLVRPCANSEPVTKLVIGSVILKVTMGLLGEFYEYLSG